MSPITILSTDRRFTDSPDVGMPECLCSRCLLVIEERCAPPIRAWPQPKDGRIAYEYRFHPHCLGMELCCHEDEYDREFDPED